MKPRLPAGWIEEIFARLLGIYGNQFRAKFSHVSGDMDVGISAAKITWAEELASFSERPEAIAYALGHLPERNAPNAVEFRMLCQACPKAEQVKKIENKTPVSPSRLEEVREKLEKMGNGPEDPLAWAKYPKGLEARRLATTGRIDVRLAMATARWRNGED